MKKFFVLTIALLSYFFECVAQRPVQSVKGKVLDAQSGSPLPGASVVLEGSDPLKGAVVDAFGFFRIPDVPLGRQVLKVRLMGYRELNVPNVLVTSGKEVLLEIRLEEHVIRGEEVVIRGGRRLNQLNNEFATVSARSFDVENTRRFAGSRNDPARMASNFAGVSGANDSRNDIVIRGNSPAGLLWRLEGVDIPNPSHFGALGATGGPVSMVNNNVLSQSDFLTGAFPANYGNALSGIFDLQFRTGNPDKREFTGQVGFNGFELGAEGPVIKGKRATYLAHYRYSVLGVMQKLGLSPGIGSSVPVYEDLAFKIDLPTSRKASRWSIFGIGGSSSVSFKGDLKDTTNLYSDPYSNLQNASRMGVAGVSYTHYFNEKSNLQSTIAISGASFATKNDSLNDAREPIPNYRDASGQGRISYITRYTSKLDAQNLFSAGVFLHRLRYQLSDSVLTNGQFRTIRNQEGNTTLAQAFVQWQYKPSDDITINSGLHGSRFGLDQKMVVEPRISFRYDWTARQSVLLAGSLNSQIQPLQVYFVKTPISAGEYIETNRQLSMTRSFQFVAGYEYQWTGLFKIKTEAYYQDLYNVPVESRWSSFSGLNLGASFASPDVDSLISEGKGRNFGVEITAERTYDKGYYLLTTLSVFDSRAKGSDGIWRNSAFNSMYVGNLLGGKEWELGRGGVIAVDAKVTLSGGRPFIPIDKARSVRDGKEVLDLEQAYLHRYKPYFRSDIKLTYRHNGKRLMHEWSVDFQNVTNTKNIFMETFDPRIKQVRTQYQMALYPNFNYRIEF